MWFFCILKADHQNTAEKVDRVCSHLHLDFLSINSTAQFDYITTRLKMIVNDIKWKTTESPFIQLFHNIFIFNLRFLATNE